MLSLKNGAMVALAALSCLSAGALAQQTRATLNNYNNTYIIPNNRFAVTAGQHNTMNGNIITSAGILADTNGWTGANTFTINPQFSGCVGYPLSTGAGSFTCSTTIPGAGIGAGAAAANLGTNQVSPTDSRYGAKCDGATVDTTSFSAAIAASKLIVLPPNVTCVVANLTITDGQTLDCNGSVLKAGAGALWMVKKTGFRSILRNCVINDPNSIMMQTTTLSSTVTPGTTVLPVASAGAFQANMIVTVQLSSGSYWTSKITSVGANTITIADAIPFTVTAATLATGGSNGYVTGDEFVLVGGVGPPTTFKLTAAAGAITGVTSIDAPGLYQTSPSTPAAVFDPLTPAAFGATLNMTYAGASAGAFVDAAFGSVLIDAASNGETTNIIAPQVPVVLEIMSSAGQSQSESIRHVEGNASQIAGLVKLQGVSNISVREARFYGFTHHGSAYGAAGVYIDRFNQTFASGGNKWDVLALGFETGLLDLNGTLDLFDNVVTDTTRNYGVVCIGCTNTNFNYVEGTFTGPQANTAIAGKGVGLYFGGTAVNNAINFLDTSGNVSDVHFGDAISAVWINNLTWSYSKLITGSSYSLFPPTKLFTIPPSAIGGLTSPQYVSSNAVSATQGSAFTLSGLRGQLTGMSAVFSIAPGAATYSAILYVNRWSGTVYLGWNAVGTCTITGSTQACSIGGAGINVFPLDQVQISVTSSTGTFVASEIVSALVNGI